MAHLRHGNITEHRCAEPETQKRVVVRERGDHIRVAPDNGKGPTKGRPARPLYQMRRVHKFQSQLQWGSVSEYRGDTALHRSAEKRHSWEGAIGAFDKKRVMMEVEEQGHPLFWGEWKPVSLFATLCRDFGVTTVVDMTPGSGAASIASLYCKVHYRGFCHNAAHKNWLLGHLRRVFVAIVMNKDVKADDNLVKNVSKYLRRAAEAARQLLPKEPNYKFPASNRPSPDDDSCDDE